MLSFPVAVADQIVDYFLARNLFDLTQHSCTSCCSALYNLSMVDASLDSRTSFESLAVDSVSFAVEVLVFAAVAVDSS